MRVTFLIVVTGCLLAGACALEPQDTIRSQAKARTTVGSSPAGKDPSALDAETLRLLDEYGQREQARKLTKAQRLRNEELEREELVRRMQDRMDARERAYRAQSLKGRLCSLLGCENAPPCQVTARGR